MKAVGVPARQEAVLRVTDQLRRMEAGGRVSAPAGLRELEKIIDAAKSRWLEEPDTKGFHFYHAAANAGLVLAMMRERLGNPSGGPDAAGDALAVMPSVDDALRAAEAREISRPAIDRALEATRVLGKTARKAGMMRVENLDGSAGDLLQKNLVPLLDHLGARTREGYSSDAWHNSGPGHQRHGVRRHTCRFSGSDDVVKHEFHDESSELLASVTGIHTKCTPYIVPMVEMGPLWVLSEAVESTVLSPATGSSGPVKGYDDVVRIHNSAVAKLEAIMDLMSREDLDEERIAANLRKVRTMSSDLARRREAERGTEGASRQLRRFVRWHPDRRDERILAEVITLMEKLGRQGRRFVIASHDSSFFSPHILDGDVSDVVTREILYRFGILCDHPRNVLRTCLGGRSE